MDSPPRRPRCYRPSVLQFWGRLEPVKQGRGRGTGGGRREGGRRVHSCSSDSIWALPSAVVLAVVVLVVLVVEVGNPGRTWASRSGASCPSPPRSTPPPPPAP